MYSQKYVNKIENLEQRRSFIRSFYGLVLFLISGIILGPLMHELGHLGVLELINCVYSMNFGLGAYNLYATIQPLCSPGLIPLAIFYSVGYIVTIVVGGYLVHLGISHRDTARHWIPQITGTGLIASMLPTLWLKGDLSNLMRMMGAPKYSLILTGVIFLGCSYLVIKSLMYLWDESKG